MWKYVHACIPSFISRPQTFPENLHTTSTPDAEPCWDPKGGDHSPQKACTCHMSVTMAARAFDLFLQRTSPPDWPALKTFSETPLLSTKSWPSFHLANESWSLTTSHLSSAEKESCLWLFTARCLLKRTWGSWMKVVDGRKGSPASQKWPAGFCLPNKDPDYSTWVCNGGTGSPSHAKVRYLRGFTKGQALWPVI